MEFEELAKNLFSGLRPKLENNKGLSIFAKERAKFEDWLKVELCEILLGTSLDVIPEKESVDIGFDDWGIELKTINTNYRYKNVKNKHRPITRNIQSARAL